MRSFQARLGQNLIQSPKDNFVHRVFPFYRIFGREGACAARETFVPLAHPPGHAQVDFGEAIGVIGGVRQKMHVFFMDLPHSDAPFMKA
jgi:hypothetical protein